MNKPECAPGCFGSALSFANDDICGTCPFKTECEPQHRRAQDQLRQLYGISLKEPRVKSGELPKKVKVAFDELGKSKSFVKEMISSGRSPWRVSDGYAGIVAHLVVSKKVIARDMLEAVVARKCGYTPNTASTYTRYAIQMLEYCEAVTVSNGQISVVEENK